jgi:hypothetical protein
VWSDYISNSKYGGGIDENYVDLTSAEALNDYSKETISYTPSGGGSASQARYKINGVLSGSETALANLDRIMAACDSWTTYNATTGKWRVVINKAETPAYAFNDGNVIGDIRISSNSITQTVNEIEASFPWAGRRDQTNYVVQTLPPEDLYPNEPIHKATLSYDLVNDDVQANYLVNRILQQARYDINVRLSTSFYGIQVEAGDVVTVTNAGFEWNNKPFRVTRVIEAVLPDGSLGAQLEMSEYNADVYDTPAITKQTPSPNTNVISPGSFGELLPPSIVEFAPDAYPPYFTVECYIPAQGYVTTVWLYYRTLPSTEYVLLDTFDSPGGTAFYNSSNVRLMQYALPPGEFYFKYKVGNPNNQSALSPSYPAGG